ncbi:hypothetical protein DPMN_104885 [Dreissena polymorpha]|uniref:G-protein coupled receptors family 1 profile domain-containing protein n=1 Tax=Dreissena polymorpha TaxID=45954 RepID=A0A9D4HDX8_DREPO|nr:hypothetical protein DPMN_104885 [Dreissena polymorpha]
MSTSYCRLLAIALMVPLFVIRQVAVMDLIPDEPLYFCNEQWPEDHHRQQYDLAQFIIVYTIPGSIICVSYGLIGSELWTEDKDLKRTESETSQGLAKNMMKGRKRVAKMLIALAVMFAICWLPYHIVSLYLDFHPGNTHFLNVLPYTIFLGHSNSALNPILYFYSSKGFRSILVRMFKCRKRPFKQVRRDNIIVRCTRNPGDGTTTAALTRRPFVRILSTTTRCQASRSGSLRLSRSNNSSLKSTSGTLRTSFKSNRSSNSNRLNDHHGPRVSFRDKCNKDNKVDNITNKKDKTDLQSSNQPICPQVHIIEPSYDEDHHNVDVDMPYHKRNFMEATISIPTTINEESSRHNSLVPVSRLSPSPSMQAIHEESVEVTQSGSDKDKFEALTIGITIKSSGASGSSNRELDVTVHNHDNDMHDTHQVIVLAD